MSISLAFGVTGYLYSKKKKRDVDKLLEKEEYEDLVEIHNDSQSFKDVLPSDYEDLNPKNMFSSAKGFAYSLALDDETIDDIYREFSKEMDIERAYQYL